ncbi:MAG: FAD-binding domain-containing protein [Bacteroidota bacterium]
MVFPTQIEAILQRIQQIDPVRYAVSRNHKDGAVTYLSPYISRGVISTRQVYEHITTLGIPWSKSEKLIQELAWRDYWQQIWVTKKHQIQYDLRSKQTPVAGHGIPAAIVDARLGIQVVDHAIRQLYKTGYMHNHMRMYVASICCNIAQTHWLAPAQWMYSHLLDGDLASNYLSWQWVAGTFSNKKYYANQANINTFFGGTQRATFLDLDYTQLKQAAIPDFLTHTIPFQCTTPLPQVVHPSLAKHKTTLVYNYYNLDPYWHMHEDVQRILLLEPSFFAKYPVRKPCVDFMLALAKNIDTIKIFVGEFSELQQHISVDHLIFKEHPTNSHYRGKEEPRDWLSSVTGAFPSFFSYWKACKQVLFR